MRIGDGPKLPPLPDVAAKSGGKTASSFPDVAKTPTPGGPLPVPYPNVSGDSFERVGKAPLGSLLAGPQAAGHAKSTATAKLAKEVGSLLAAGDAAAALDAWKGGIAAGGGINVMEAVTLVLKESIRESNEDKKYFLGKLQEHNAQASKLSDYLEVLVDASGELAAQERSPDEAGSSEEANAEVLLAQLSKLTQTTADLDAALGEVDLAARESVVKQWEEKLNSLGDDAQLANVDLQNILQKQQQTLQMMSNIGKMLFDTAQSVIRKIGG